MFEALTDNFKAKEVVIKAHLEKHSNIDLIPSDLCLSVLSEFLKLIEKNLYVDGLKTT
ncbi:hypothetical protein [Paraclostridium sordellii]|uniref:hypothetical protein n=1 Tax=Paraclostridium sordellii TaxID=1505 RepID=UPI0005E9AC01|nr:hypothetical protein [Paeniclostridium sordellii]CEN21725.1 Uncharacterised protein [[Clostridium] sordellii] [Paeniclostridium sordellii]